MAVGPGRRRAHVQVAWAEDRDCACTSLLVRRRLLTPLTEIHGWRRWEYRTRSRSCLEHADGASTRAPTPTSVQHRRRSNAGLQTEVDRTAVLIHDSFTSRSATPADQEPHADVRTCRIPDTAMASQLAWSRLLVAPRSHLLAPCPGFEPVNPGKNAKDKPCRSTAAAPRSPTVQAKRPVGRTSKSGP